MTLPASTTPDPARWGRLRPSKRLRNRSIAGAASLQEQRASADALDRDRKLTSAALAWHWLESRGLA